MTTLALDTSILISHLSGDRFAEETDNFLRRAIENKSQLVIPDVVYSELYTGIFLAPDPKVEEARVQSLLKVNGVEVRTSRSLKVARRAGELYSRGIRGKAAFERILPDFLIAAQAEATSDEFVTWNDADYADMGLRVPVLRPSKA
ncbi:MAG: type II toxin-antitoxin system VapC family toxin [Nitrososphaerota archaeon]|jgi:predicted nucleic acid-binding protein|nr:type II toxin-antitoxin system VapC family toxin [Nitrososphaerota archaeon]MDG6949479.1 type II toxin-antitoxin system VapC family toxin [Nitrososphaerota archaeon]